MCQIDKLSGQCKKFARACYDTNNIEELKNLDLKQSLKKEQMLI